MTPEAVIVELTELVAENAMLLAEAAERIEKLELKIQAVEEASLEVFAVIGDDMDEAMARIEELEAIPLPSCQS